MSPSRKKKPKKAKKSKKTPEPAPVLETDAAIATSEKPGLKRYAVFRVGQQKYAVDVDNIIEVLHQFTVERVSHLPDVFPGVINLRGTSIPVVDLPCLLREETIASDEKTCLIAMLDKEQIGFLIDSDIEIIMSDEGRVHALPDCYTREEAGFIDGILGLKDDFMAILNPDGVIKTLTDWQVPDA